MTCFVLYLKIIKTFLKIICGPDSKFSKELKNAIEILVGEVLFKLWIKTVKIMFWSRTTWPTSILCFFWVLWTVCFQMHTFAYFSQRCWQFLDRAQHFWIGYGNIHNMLFDIETQTALEGVFPFTPFFCWTLPWGLH